MSAKALSSRAIIGTYFKRLALLDGSTWIDNVSMMINSDQESEEYRWLGQIPTMREWIGGRQAKGFSDETITITNRHYEATLEVLTRELRLDKTGQVLIRIAELARRTNSHWASLLTTLIDDGISTACYDGQFFFDVDHQEGNNVDNQSNDIDVDISALPTTVHGVVTAPSVEEMQLSITQGIQQIVGFLDNENEPMNEDAKSFMVMVPLALWSVTQAALANPMLATGASQTSLQGLTEFAVKGVANVRLDNVPTPWDDSFAIFRTDGDVKPLIRQQETPVQMKAIAEGSELEFNEDKHHYGVDTWRNVGYGFWQHAVYVTMI